MHIWGAKMSQERFGNGICQRLVQTVGFAPSDVHSGTSPSAHLDRHFQGPDVHSHPVFKKIFFDFCVCMSVDIWE